MAKRARAEGSRSNKSRPRLTASFACPLPHPRCHEASRSELNLWRNVPAGLASLLDARPVRPLRCWAVTTLAICNLRDTISPIETHQDYKHDANTAPPICLRAQSLGQARGRPARRASSSPVDHGRGGRPRFHFTCHVAKGGSRRPHREHGNLCCGDAYPRAAGSSRRGG